MLKQLAHPELKKRFRTSRLLEFFREENPKVDLTSATDDQIVELFCAAHKEMAARDDRVDYFDDFVSSEIHGNYAVVHYESGWRSKHSSQVNRMPNQIVLKKSDGRWLFLWSMAVSIHVDLDWDATKEVSDSSPGLTAPSITDRGGARTAPADAGAHR